VPSDDAPCLSDDCVMSVLSVPSVSDLARLGVRDVTGGHGCHVGLIPNEDLNDVSGGHELVLVSE
jgi:hypothetical protein